MIERVYLVFEVLAILLGLWALHGWKKRPTIVTLVYICVELIVMASIDIGWLPTFFSYILYMGIIILCVFEFGDKVYDACIYFALNIGLISIVQLICALFFCLLFQTLHTNTRITLLINIATCCILLLTYFILNLHKYVEIILKHSIISKIILLIVGILFVVMLGISRKNFQIYWKDAVQLAVFGVLIFAVIFQWQKEKWENKQKEEELKAYQKYNLVYKDLISDVRKRQHDFNNHIQAIFSMNLLAQSMEELVEKQNEYCSQIVANNTTNKLLRQDVSSVFAGFLYTKINQAEQSGITVKYRININNIEEHMSFCDLVEIIGNLFDNAIEAACVLKENKLIDFFINQREGEVEIVMSNPFIRDGLGQVEDILQEGVSTKGEGRGLGMSNVTSAVEKYHGKILIKSNKRGNVDFIVFRIRMKIK